MTRTGTQTGAIELAPYRRRREARRRRAEEAEWRRRSEQAAPVMHAQFVCEACGQVGHRARYCTRTAA
jgi:hypothetical protein